MRSSTPAAPRPKLLLVLVLVLVLLMVPRMCLACVLERRPTLSCGKLLLVVVRAAVVAVVVLSLVVERLLWERWLLLRWLLNVAAEAVLLLLLVLLPLWKGRFAEVARFAEVVRFAEVRFGD